MMRLLSLIPLLGALSTLFHSCQGSDYASFYGSSYVSVPLKEAKSSTDIHLKFRTRSHSALLMLVAGATDYCSIQLDSGRIRLKINLGAGESELVSPKGLVFNDLKWHEIFVVRREANLTVLVDNIHSLKIRIPGKFFELNIHYGVFVGGRGDFSELFLGHLENFRGCLTDVVYNGIALLEQGRRRLGKVTVQGVTWNCAAEFEADTAKDVSFVEEGAFVLFGYAMKHLGFRWEVELKTTSEHGVILYNTGSLSKSDLFAVELWNGHVKLTFKQGSGEVELLSNIFASDGHWHKIILQMVAPSIELMVDSDLNTAKLPQSGVYAMELSEAFYMGGIEVGKRTRAMAKGLRTADTSLKGCMRNIVFEDKRLGFPDVKISEGLIAGCVWKYPCNRKPCLEDAVCLHKGLDSFQCKCDKKLCVNPNFSQAYKVFSESNVATDLELLSVKPLQLAEGENALLTASTLHIALDYPKYGIRDSGIIFHIVEPPMYGSITVDVWPKRENAFTFLDLTLDKVHYVHDGSENLNDHAVMEVQFLTSDTYILPEYLQGKHRFSLPVQIAPLNDPPVISIPPTAVLRLAQGSRKLITSKLLRVIDPDSDPGDLVVTLMDKPPVASSRIERKSQPGVAVAAFTQKEIDDEQIVYVDGGLNGSTQLAFQASDGIETSPVAFLRVSTFAQSLRLENNTGAVLVHRSHVVVTPANLSFVSNVDEGRADVRYDVVRKPLFGAVELLAEDGVWREADAFTSSDVELGKVRYKHSVGFPELDELKFRASLKFVNSTTVYNFRLTFTKLTLKSTTDRTVLMNDTRETFIAPRSLAYSTSPVETRDAQISYTVVQLPQYGYLYMPLSIYLVQNGSTFTQEDIRSNNLVYRFYRKSYSFVSDSFSFSVAAPGARPLRENLTVIYHPSRELANRVNVKLENLQVEEGGSGNITTNLLDIRGKTVSSLIYNVTQPPSNGRISSNGRNSTLYFTSEELERGAVSYVHDDSETQMDSFHFLAMSKEEEKDFQYFGVFHVDVQLKNDNSPAGVIEKTFYIVTGGVRLLTGSDLRYADADVDADTADIVYTYKEIPNGAIFRTGQPTEELFRFTQEDLDNGYVSFRHHGDELATMKFWVSDGVFQVAGHLIVQASEPFVRVATTKKIVQQNRTAVVSSQELAALTNIYAAADEIIYQVSDPPGRGSLRRADGEAAAEFSQFDVDSGRITYEHDGTAPSPDRVIFRVKCLNVTTSATLDILVLPHNYWLPLSASANTTVFVEESTSVAVPRRNLEVVQDEVPAKKIVYYVKEQPRCGYLAMPAREQLDAEIKNFTQAEVNEKQLLYVQSAINETSDLIVFNVTNGIVWLNDLALRISVVPEHLFMGTKPLSVVEGKGSAISLANIFPVTEYYRKKVSDYVVMRSPVHGCLQVRKRCSNHHSFSHDELALGMVWYIHDNSENMDDKLLLVAVAGKKRSEPFVMDIIVAPMNDQAPKVVNNTGIELWKGGSIALTNTNLGALDRDEPKEVLMYFISEGFEGNISLSSDPSVAVMNFTQDRLEKGEVLLHLFADLNSTKLTFTVSDGQHTTEAQDFIVTTKPAILQLVQAGPVHVFPLQRIFLSPYDLLTICSDPDRDVDYTIVSPPSLGRLMVQTSPSGGFRVVTEFTQTDLNSSRVFYEHTHPFADLYANDSFLFEASVRLGERTSPRDFHIDVSISSGGLEGLIATPAVDVDEGGSASVRLNLSEVVGFLENHSGLRMPIIHTLASRPAHGRIQLLGGDQEATTFTQQQLESGQLRYQHDHSDSSNDTLGLSLFLVPGYVALCNVTVPIRVHQINDQPFRLVTPAPSVAVVQGENYTIGRRELLTEDPDNSPAEIVYDIITSPAEGKLVYAASNGEAAPLSKFSQEDVDMGRVVYCHSGSSKQVTFYFRVWDGKFKPEYTLFYIQVIPVSVNVTNGQPVALQQGSNVAFLAAEQFGVVTNAAPSRISYRITTPPKHGVLYVRDSPTTTFRQEDLFGRSVMYMQTDMTASNDSFAVHVGVEAAGSVVVVDVAVQPLMLLGNLTALAGKKNRLTTEALDATPLAKLTASNPRYTVVDKPHLGQIRKIIRSSGEQRSLVDAAVRTFTHDEVKSGLIYYTAGDLDLDWRGAEDFLVFRLASSIFQPAVGRLKIYLRSRDHAANNLGNPNDPASHEGGMIYASPNMSSDYFLAATLAVGVVLLGLAVTAVTRCNVRESPVPPPEEDVLPRPPSRLVAPQSLPQCKVTALDASPELDLHTSYPYGTPEEEWNSYEAPRGAGVMLRRNQYWV